MEQQYLYLECVEKDKKRGQNKDSDQEVKPWRGWSALQTVVMLQQDWRYQLQTVVVWLLNPAIENLFLHNNHWKDKHVVTLWLWGMVR